MKYWLFALRTLTISISWLSAAAQAPDGSDTAALPRLSQAAVRLRRFPLPAGQWYFITDPGREGMFRADPADRTTPDDSAMTLVTASGIRIKRVVEGRSLNVTWFGARGYGSTDDWQAIQKGIAYILANDHAPRTLYFPAGLYRISRPLLIARLTGNSFRQASINLEGPANAKDLSTGGATILPAFNNSFAIGIQLGKGVLIKDLFIRGMFHFPDRLNQIQVDTLAFNEWSDGSTRDNPVSPYAGIAIDPFSDPAAFASEQDMYPGLREYYVPGLGRSGSTAVQITGCSITDFIVGVMLTPSNQQNGELIDVIDCDISNNRVAYAMGQAQSKECHVERLKVWGATHTIFDNVNFGLRHGDGAAAPMVDGVNIAGYVKQLCYIAAPSFSGSFRNIYGEGLFRLGYIGGAASLSFEDCQLDFATQAPGIPYPDFYVIGSGASFHGCILRTYMDGKGYRLVLAGNSDTYEGGTMNEPPVVANLNDCGLCPTPLFRNVIMYYAGGILGSSNYGVTMPGRVPGPSNIIGVDPVYYGNTYLFLDPYGVDLAYRYTYNTGFERTIALGSPCIIHTDKKTWTGYFKLRNAADTGLLRKDDIILTAYLPYQDQFRQILSTTYPVGFVQRIGHDTVWLRNLAYGIREGMQLPVWSDYYVMAKAPFTGDVAAGSNAITHVQGRFPFVGDRPDMPMLATGAYVTAVDTGAKTIFLSTPNTSGRSFADYTFINGYPAVEMHSCYDLPTLVKYHKTLIGGSTFYLHELVNPKVHEPNYLLGGNIIAQYRNVNTLIGGDSTWHRLRFEPIPASRPPAYQSPNTVNN
ncbi:MAG TPA: glycosyl hydrolase family 28-related protein [Puia sp.]|nr:glycosyl hydrolase family 28-related protein [Puia sp.]